jgi:hypothetical protein
LSKTEVLLERTARLVAGKGKLLNQRFPVNTFFQLFFSDPFGPLQKTLGANRPISLRKIKPPFPRPEAFSRAAKRSSTETPPTRQALFQKKCGLF